MDNPLLAAFEQVVRVERRLPIQPRGHVVVKEKDAGATLTHLNIDCRGCGEVLAFTLDARSGNRRPIPLSEHTSKAQGVAWNKVCDGVFVWLRANALHILVCDLKSSTPSGSDWKEQLWSSSCFVRYLLEIIRQFQSADLSGITCQFHAVAFHGGGRITGAGKRRTGVSLGVGYPSTSLSAPGRMPVSNNSYVPLNALCP